ncbi:MAG: hypothetical protein P8L75_06535 [Gammaproteobacteria bacterium]|jgi:hypothetical protein|nr:hypothetical protein [Gammaproteobacteria bacterium]
MTEKKVIHEIKMDKSIKAILWGFVLAIMLNAAPKGLLVEDALADIASHPTITLLLGETGYGVDIDD